MVYELKMNEGRLQMVETLPVVVVDVPVDVFCRKLDARSYDSNPNLYLGRRIHLQDCLKLVLKANPELLPKPFKLRCTGYGQVAFVESQGKPVDLDAFFHKLRACLKSMNKEQG